MSQTFKPLSSATSSMLNSSMFSRKTRRLFPVLSGLFALSLGACMGLDDSASNRRFGSISLRATGTQTGPFAATPTAVFFTGSESTLPTSVTTTDQCNVFPFTGEQIVPGNLAAGETIDLNIGGQSYSLSEPPAVARIYTLPAPGIALYMPGDTARITTPGVAGGFPGGAVAVRLAEPVQLGPLSPVTTGEDFPVSWATNGDARSGIVISMRFALGTDDEANRQLLCVVRDNGSYTIPGGQLTEWSTSNAAFRSMNVLRWRTNTADIDERSKLYIVSSIDTTVVNFP